MAVFERLLASPTWLHEAQAGDGAHPGAASYTELAELVWPAWFAWLTEDPSDA